MTSPQRGQVSCLVTRRQLIYQPRDVRWVKVSPPHSGQCREAWKTWLSASIEATALARWPRLDDFSGRYEPVR